MPFRIGVPELLLILVIVILLFGVGRIGKMKSIGTNCVPWCRSWKKACWPLVPGSPQMTGPVA